MEKRFTKREGSYTIKNLRDISRSEDPMNCCNSATKRCRIKRCCYATQCCRSETQPLL